MKNLPMEDSKEQSIHHTAVKICEDIQSLPSYQNLYTNVQVCAHIIIHNQTIFGYTFK